MPSQVRHYTATIPAGTPIASPAVIPITFPPMVVVSIYWRVPNGCMGVMGWNLSMGGVQVLPTGGDQWVLANDEHDTWYPDDQPDGGTWEVTGYNTGAHPHNVYLAFSLDKIPAKVAPPPAPLAPWAYSSLDLSQAGPPVARRK